MSQNRTLLMAVEISRIASFSSPRGPQKQKMPETCRETRAFIYKMCGGTSEVQNRK